MEGRTPTQQQVLDPSDALTGVGVVAIPPPPGDAPHQPTSFFNSPTTQPTEDTPAPQTTTRSPPQPQPPPQTHHEPDILKTKPFPHSSTRDLPPPNIVPPFTVTRTASSSSVSASARVHIETPFSRFSLRQGADDAQAPALPAPHLRPSLLKLAAQAMTDRARRQSRRTRSVASNDKATLVRRQPPSPPPNLPVSLLTKTHSMERLLTGYANFRSFFLVPRFRATLKQDRRQTQTQKFRDNETSSTPTTIVDSESLCSGKTHALLAADTQTDCRSFHACIPQLSDR